MAATFLTILPTLAGQAVATLTETPLADATPAANFFNSVAGTISAAIADVATVNTPGGTTTPSGPPDKFAFTDFTVDVSGSVTGDLYKGSTAFPITAQFLDLTPDNLLISATAPNVFMQSDSGNDILRALSGTNILEGGSGINTFIAGSGKDEMLSDATNANVFASILNAKSGDDAVITGVNLSDFTFSAKNTAAGLEFDATPKAATGKTAAMVLQGYTTADIGTKLTIGVNTGTTPATSFMFLHVN